MTRREKMLAVAVAGLILVWGGRSALTRYHAALADRNTEMRGAEAELADLNLQIADGRRAMRLLDRWQKRSLPTDVELARSLYRTWLADLLKEAGVQVGSIDRNLNTSSATAYEAIGYRVEGIATLEAVTEFLHGFYRSDQLHKLTLLDLRPLAGTTDLRMILNVEAIALPGATRRDRLSDGVSDRLAHAEPSPYTETIGKRNVFRVYTPPRPEPPPRVAQQERDPTPPKPKFDDATKAYLTAVIGTGATRQAWINVRTTGESLRLVEGDPIRVGLLEGHIASIGLRDIVIESAEGRWRIKIGEHLREGTELPGGG